MRERGGRGRERWGGGGRERGREKGKEEGVREEAKCVCCVFIYL